ncbi:hypothetical protein LNTAR_16468 [Lentisphaera araneosa HTCC2155]|uniref:Lambda-carrageenase n=2 Tax=Lentisphaera TaxID=256846 RepID=A6DQA8_9BACT|nr:hypothetical protein LNTAR_16468 [Lentisphaera araneosa HTCC2155]
MLAALFVSYGVDAKSFVTDDKGLRRGISAMHNDTPVLYLGELDGSVSCYTLEGEKLWRNATKKPGVLFEIIAVDVDDDGREDLISACGNGFITCWKSDGSLLWRFSGDHKIRFNEVAALKHGDELTIFAGGNDKVVYALNKNGKVIHKHAFAGAIRKLEVGDFKKDGQPLLFVMTMKHDKLGWSSFGFHDPNDLKNKVASLSSKKRSKYLAGIITDVRVTDLDADGRDDLMISSNDSAVMCTLNGEFKEIASYDAREDQSKAISRTKQRYAHSSSISLAPARDEILLQFGRTFYLLDSTGELMGWSGDMSARFPMADFCYHSGTGRFFGIGSVGGDNGVYEFDLTKDDWWKDHVHPVGVADEVITNLEKLYKEVLGFTPPTYQKPAKNPWVMTYSGEIPKEVEELKFNEVNRSIQYIWSEKYDRSAIIKVVGEEYGNKRDKRKPYNDSHADIVKKAEDFEKNKTPFTIWAGHGGDPFFMNVDTLEKILEVAPNTCNGFVYAEMADTKDPRVHYFIDVYLPRLVDACRKQGRAKLFFRYKQTFWATTVHMHPWSEMFLSGKYSDVLLPATEDTNSTTQELNLAGRVGMFAGGYINDYCMRLVDDNPTGWRPLAPGRQKTISPFLRSGVMQAAYGARYGVLWGFEGHDGPGLELLIALMGSGVLPRAEAKDILSIGSWHLMRDIPHDIEERAHGLGHDISQYLEEDSERVIANSEVHWGGASVNEYDLSKAMGVEYRWLNFMPELPYGMIPIAPAEYAVKLQEKGVEYTESNSLNGLVNNTKIDAVDFGETIINSAKAGMKKMPLVVSGVAWSAIRIDESHIRLILIDPGYLDPQERMVEIYFHNKRPVSAKDILTGKSIGIENNVFELRIPAGSMRFIDLEY